MQKCKQNKTPYIPVGITYQTNYAVDDESRELKPYSHPIALIFFLSNIDL